MESISVGVPADAWELRRCRELGPGLSGPTGCWCGFLETHGIRHCVAACWWPANGDRELLAFDIFLSPALGESEAGFFMHSFLDYQGKEGCRVLQSRRAFPAGHPTAEALKNAGFEARDSHRRYRIQIESIRQRLRRLASRRFLPQPSSFRWKPVRDLEANRLQGFLESCDLVGEIRAVEPDRDLSLALIHEGRIVAAGVVHRNGPEKVAFLLRAVAKDFPGGRWLGNLILIREIESRLPKGIRFCDFEARPELHRETIHLAKKLGGEELPEAAVWRRTLSLPGSR
ncbi:hypothetical protein HNR46_000173 [Haloferula luteola]|uniref:N-acetyltransferase domain-containing protein n=1 Tax=Haloferula luteola TaxID=595692 RepID=A0A840UVZ1_9BACT|nr:hypothetical protein [Haloferula luteola]MBB5349952.1 hypothetical protein [Haloferula luteola]